MKKYCKERQRDLALDLEMVVVVHCGEASPGKRLFSKTRNCISKRNCLSKESCSKKVTISFYRNETSDFKDKLQIRRSILSIQHPPLQREVVKNGYFMVRLTVSVNNPPPPHPTVSFLWFFCVFDLSYNENMFFSWPRAPRANLFRNLTVESAPTSKFYMDESIGISTK